MQDVECPYCEYDNSVDCTDLHTDGAVMLAECDNCDKEFEVVLSYLPVYFGEKIEKQS